MKGLRKYISPFTPDQSGAVSVLFGYGGMLIIMDAGGCVGNVCGYDEPRWGKAKSAIFSAGLRDLDAILGRDELLIRKIRQALGDMDANFVGLIGTPVPATIATDYRALKRLMEKDYEIPVLPVDTNGIELYDRGQEKAYRWLFREFLEEPEELAKTQYHETSAANNLDNTLDKNKFIGVLGATPLDCTAIDGGDEFRRLVPEHYGMPAVVYGMGDTLEDVARASMASRNLVVSPSGLQTARMLEEDYGIPYDIGYPVDAEMKNEWLHRIEAVLESGKASENVTGETTRILIIHQQVFANEIRNWLHERLPELEINASSWFRMDAELMEEGDFSLNEEDDLLQKANENQYDIVIGDPLLKRALPHWKGTYLTLPHFPISGELHSSVTSAEYWRKAGEQI